MEFILFSEFSLLIWGLWALIALFIGYLVASAFEDPDETAVTVGAVTVGFGVWGALWGDGFFRSAGEALGNLFMALLLVPGWPAAYFFWPGWQAGKLMGFEWLGCLATSFFVAIAGGLMLMALWVATLSFARRTLPEFVASMFAIPVFGIAPIIGFIAA